METLIIKVKSEKGRKLVSDLEELELLEVVKATEDNNQLSGNLSDLKSRIKLPMQEEAIDEQLQKIGTQF